jgi:hypothetical protein
VQQKQFEVVVMSADRAGLGLLGFIFGGVTAAVMLVACTIVVGHVEGRWTLDPSPVNASTTLAAIQ